MVSYRIGVKMKNKLLDKDFFELYCKSADIVFNNGDSEVAFIKDHDLKYCYISPAYLASLRADGVITPDYIEGNNCVLKKNEQQAKILDDFAKQDKLVQSTLKVHNFIFVSVHNEITLVRKRPIINPATGNFVGIMGTARPFLIPNLLDLIYKMNGITFGLANFEQNGLLAYKLTSRQHLVLFLYINKYSNTEIADIISLVSDKMSGSRVNDHLENLKYIFQVSKKEQLIEKAINLKYHRYIPRQLIKSGSFILEDESVVL